MIDVNYDVLDRTKDIHSCFQCKQMGIYVDNLIKRYKTFRVLGENLAWTCLFFSSGRVKGVISNKTTSNSLIFHSHHELKGIQWEKERAIIVRITYSKLGPILAWNTMCMRLDVTITIICTSVLLLFVFLNFIIIWLWGTFLVISCIRLPINNYEANVNANPLWNFSISLL